MKKIVCLFVGGVFAVSAQITPLPKSEITPLPVDKTDPALKEFRRIDSNKDDSLTFTEFLLADRSFIELQSRRFHALDANADSVISRKEYEDYHKKSEKRQSHSDFFNRFNRRDLFDAPFFGNDFSSRQLSAEPLDLDGSREELQEKQLENAAAVLATSTPKAVIGTTR
ncbi:unnamed protein product [Caenorhabditis auriculariae]|uniref:EF-hand domain-containing protein n=1 Tax=Caenorhabditis auriculariae TaxID=2777116 RepID=A0A8S1HU68_9PELO|nr:unnamed protein product [Caenorhabditis auriculariae]